MGVGGWKPEWELNMNEAITGDDGYVYFEHGNCFIVVEYISNLSNYTLLYINYALVKLLKIE